MKIANNLIAAVCLLIPAVATQAADASRTARIEDTSGVKTEVSDLKVHLKPILVRLPMNARTTVSTLPSPTARSRFHVLPALHHFLGRPDDSDLSVAGQQRTISGALDANFAGQSDFGTFELSSAKLRQLIFNGPSAAADLRPPGPQGQFVTASVVLKNGTASS